ncbi:MAG: FAD-binding protein [Desulfobacterales bacterium]|nr:MAG: FAD-binding protein [Desulfobacterales bacterium]
MNSRIIEFLKATVGAAQVTNELIDLISHSTDASGFRHRPEVVVYATTTEQVSAILKMVHEERIPLTPRGAGTNVSGEAVPIKGGIVLDLSRMDQILEISLEDRVVVVQPGVIYADLNHQLAPLGFAFPPDPSSGKVATLGGNVATNAGGVRASKYGVTKDYVRGLQVVLPGGQVMRTGTRTMKSSSGFNLTQLFVGSEGTLGVITEITLKIAPKPTETYTAMATFQRLVDAGRAVSQIMRSGAVPSVLEIVEKNCIKAINQNTDLNLPEVEAVLLTETDGFVKEEALFQMNKIIETLRANGALEVRWAETAAEAEALWSARKSSYPVISRLNNTTFGEDITVPLSKVPDMLKALEELGAKYDLILPTVGHLGDGNMHPHFSYDRTNPDEVQRVKKAEKELYHKTIELGGTLSGEHGIGLAKAPFMSLEHDPVAMETMRALKKMFDPHNVLNPGKMNLEACHG